MCSLRSWPTQNARPVPVSTTQRTAGSSAAWRTASSSASLVATSRLFIASGRLRVMVATPSATSSRTGCASAVMAAAHAGRRVSDAQAAGHEAVGGRLEPAGLARSNSSAAAVPGQSRGSSSAGSPGSANRNLRHSCTSTERTANACSSGRVGDPGELRVRVVEQPLGEPPPRDVRRGQRRPGPTPAGPLDRVVVVRPGTGRTPAPSAVEQRVDLGGGERADPGAVRERR